MKRIIISLIAGVIFGGGLAFSGMADPKRVQGFLDLFGNWDPTLVFVMGGAIIPMSITWLFQKRLAKPVADVSFDLPGTSRLDSKLIGGSALFGIGWGISGLCPGPGIADLTINPLPAAAYVAALLAGMLIHRAAH